MSHNKLTIGTATGDRASSVPLKTVHLNDVSSAIPNNGECLSWNGLNWVSSSIGGGGGTALTATVVAWVGGYFTPYGIGNNMMSAVGNFYYMALGNPYYRCKYYHNATSATWYTATGDIIAVTGATWVDRVQLTAGTYLLRAQHIVTGGTNPWVDVQWQTEAGVALSPIRRISSIFNACNVLGMITTTTTVKVGLTIIAKSSSSVKAPDDAANARLEVTIMEIT